MPAAPLAISSQSRRKLKSFEFHADKTAPNGKENATYLSPERQHTHSKATSRNVDQNDRDPSDHFPQTPCDKISFADLIANPEDALSRIISATPNEQVEWKHVPGSSDTTDSVRPSQRGRKRIYSSSPASSSKPEPSKHFNDKDPLDLESIGRSLRTPRQEDPALILWDRYAEIYDGAGNTEPTLPPLPPMSSSPNTPNALQKSEGLRRTASCGVAWPVSATKRRKIADTDPHCRAKGIFAANKSVILGKDNSRHSRVSMLVDSIQQSLSHKITTIPEGPSSSSPIPDGRSKHHFPPATLRDAENAVAIPIKNDLNAGIDEVAKQEASSEFGDDDFDMDDSELLEVLDQAGPCAVSVDEDYQKDMCHTNQNSLQEVKDPSLPMPSDKFNTSGHRTTDNKQSSAPNDINGTIVSQKALQDSFDESDTDEAFASELAQLADSIESQEPAVVSELLKISKQQQTKPVSRDVKTTGDQLDDTFDDAFDDNDEEDDGDIWDEIDSTAARPMTNVIGVDSQKSNDSRAIKRYLICDVFEGTYKTLQGRIMPEKMLSIKDEKTKHRYSVSLRQSWYDTRCTRDSYIHLIGTFTREGRCVVDDKDNMIILHPDHLISATVVADSFTCTRRATLQDRIKATNPAEAPQLYGHLIHEVFGEALKRNKWGTEDLRSIIQSLLPNYIESLYEIGVLPHDATEYVMSKMPELRGWASVFINPSLVSDAQIRDRNGTLVSMTINKLLELEEHVWSPMYGLKGNIDATVQVQMKLPTDQSPKTLTVPLELKTGKRDTNEMHRAQTALYTLLLSDRYDIEVTSGILYYLETSKTFRVESIRNEIRHMIIQRNELACYVHDKLALPPMIRKEHLCKKCYARTSCFAYHKLVEGGDGESSGMKEIFNEAISHLRSLHQEFFKQWDDLLTKEERDTMKFRRELWTMLGTEREALGRCFSNVVIEPGSAIENNDGSKINRYTYAFKKADAKPGFTFMESQITVGEPIVISDMQGHFALANGYVTSVRPMRVVVAVDRRLQNARQKLQGFDPDQRQIFSGIMDISGDPAGPTSTSEGHPIVYRIDKDEFANGMATARNNILRIMEKGLYRARELRELIIEKKPPTFKHTSTAYTLSGPASQQNLNVDQRNAIEKVMSARDYALVLGMPGSGKTTTIAHIIRALVAQGKSVLLTSYTHTAVDNILLKIKDDRIPILRLGAVGKVHPEVQNFADLGGVPKKSVPELEESWTKSKVVATTCLGINHAIFNHRKFDYCIVDEASQITLPVCLGPIRLASTFILVGDHYQLPPLVQNKEAQEGGLNVSLFKLLSDAQPSSVVNLEHQYRMAEDIMIFSNMLVYNGRLKCGTAAVASRLLSIPNLDAGLDAHHYPASNASTHAHGVKACILDPSRKCWLKKALLPNNRSIFLNTDTLSDKPGQLGSPEHLTGSGTRITNQSEAVLTTQVLTTLIRSGVSPKSIGVITFYRSQLALLRTNVKAMAGSFAASDVEMHTADKYQGRDKEVILLSCVRSNETCNVGELLKDWRRVNVALTRARSKLIIIGSASTLQGSNVPVLKGLIDVVAQKKWMVNLPVGAIESHFFEGTITQTQTQRPVSHNETNSHNAGNMRTAYKAAQRSPLGPGNANTAGRNPAKQSRVPNKVVHGTMDVGKLLQKNPIMQNIADELMHVIEID